MGISCIETKFALKKKKNYSQSDQNTKPWTLLLSLLFLSTPFSKWMINNFLALHKLVWNCYFHWLTLIWIKSNQSLLLLIIINLGLAKKFIKANPVNGKIYDPDLHKAAVKKVTAYNFFIRCLRELSSV